MRQLRVLIQGLSPDGALGRAMRGHNWLDANYQLADIFDMLHRLFNQGFWQNAKEGTQYKDVKPVWRPGEIDAEEEHKATTSATAIAYIEQYRARRESEGA